MAPGYFEVKLYGGGATRDTQADGTDTMYDYFAYMEAGGEVYNLVEYAANPTYLGPGAAQSQATIALGGGGQIVIIVESYIASGARSLLNTYTFQSLGYDLRNARFYQYMDSDIYHVDDDVLTVGGNGSSLVLTTIDPSTSKRQAQSPGPSNNGAYLSGFGADEYPQLQDRIEGGGYSPASTGSIDTLDVPPGVFSGIGAGYGPTDITTTLAYSFTAVANATISTVLGVREMQARRPIIVMPGILGSMPVSGTISQFLVTPGHQPSDLIEEPFLGTYGPLLRTLDDRLGYDRGLDLFFGAYDWRLPIAPPDGVNDGLVHLSGINCDDGTYQFGVEYLDYWMRKAKEQWTAAGNPASSFKVDIVAHSMGGLVTRAFMQSDRFQSMYAGSINNVITIGTPHEGSVDAFLWLAPNLGLDELVEDAHALLSPATLSTTAVLNLLWDAAKATGLVGAAVGAWAPGLYDLLPTFGFLSAGAAGTAPPQDAFINRLLLDLNANAGYFTGRAAGTVNLLHSSGLQTLSGVRYVLGTAIQTSFSDVGDGTVLAISATMNGLATGTAIIPPAFASRHQAMPADTAVQLAVVQQCLGLATPSGFQPSAHDWLHRFTNFVAGCFDPVDFVLSDSNGRRLGHTEAVGYLNEFPGAFYSGDGQYEFFLLPDDGTVGNVNVQLTGLGQPYMGRIIYAQERTTSVQNVGGVLGLGQTASASVLTPDCVRPTAAMRRTKGPRKPGKVPHRVTVYFSDDRLLDAGTLGKGDILVTGPRRFKQTAAAAFKSPRGSGTKLRMDYSIKAPGGKWDRRDNGTYTVWAVAGGVIDAKGNSVAKTKLGTFKVVFSNKTIERQRVADGFVTTCPAAGSPQQAAGSRASSPARRTHDSVLGLANDERWCV